MDRAVHKKLPLYIRKVYSISSTNKHQIFFLVTVVPLGLAIEAELLLKANAPEQVVSVGNGSLQQWDTGRSAWQCGSDNPRSDETIAGIWNQLLSVLTNDFLSRIFYKLRSPRRSASGLPQSWHWYLGFLLWILPFFTVCWEPQLGQVGFAHRVPAAVAQQPVSVGLGADISAGKLNNL